MKMVEMKSEKNLKSEIENYFQSKTEEVFVANLQD